MEEKIEKKFENSLKRKIEINSKKKSKLLYLKDILKAQETIDEFTKQTKIKFPEIHKSNECCLCKHCVIKRIALKLNENPI